MNNTNNNTKHKNQNQIYKSFYSLSITLLFLLSFFSVSYCKTPESNPVAASQSPATKFKVCPDVLPENMSCIPGGAFIMGSDTSKWKDERPAHKVIISTFLMDKYEVTVKRYKKCMKEKKCSFAHSNYLHMREDNYPQLRVSWFQARKFCNTYGKRLPTEAEFEKASRGTEGWKYPWGNEKADCSRAVIKIGKLRGCRKLDNPKYLKLKYYKKTGSVMPVGSKPPTRYGLYDIIGNAHEWVNDWYEKSYTKCGANCSGRDPRGPCKGALKCKGYHDRSVKGGSWYWNYDWARSAKRRAHIASNKPPHHFGFRCAKDL